MAAKTDLEAIHAIGEEVFRLLSLPIDRLDAEAASGLMRIAEIALYKQLLRVQLPQDLAQ